MYKIINLENYKDAVDWMLTARTEELIQNGEVGLELLDGTVLYLHYINGKVYITTDRIFDKDTEVRKTDLSYIVDIMWKHISIPRPKAVVDIYKEALIENFVDEEQLKKVLLPVAEYFAEKMFSEINKAD